QKTEKQQAFQLLITQQKDFDILFHNALIIDGTGTPPYKADLLVSGDSIAFIGAVDTAKINVTQFIDASKRVLSPGFIDTHAHGDPLKTPEFKNFISMGVTTICLGQDGFSPEYKNLNEWIEKIEQTSSNPNIAMFTGHSTLRILSGVGYNPEPDSVSLQKMADILKNHLNQGSFGLTTGLEYTPGTFAKSEELNYLAKVVGENGGMIMSHMRNEDDNAIESSIKELLAQGKYCPVHISHLKVVYGKGKARAEEILSLLSEARAQGIAITADIYPYTASFTGIGIVFPEWAKPPNNYNKVKQERRTELAAFLKNRVNKRNGPEATLFGTAPYRGKTLAEIANEKDKSFELVLLEDIGPQGASAAYFVMNEKLQSNLLKDSLTMVCSDGSPTMNHPRGYGSFSKIIDAYVVKDSLFSLPEAIRKMTYLPAQTLKINDRGKIAVGMKADLVLFNPTEVSSSASFEKPHQLAKGFDMVVINGVIVKKNNIITSSKSGRILKKTD
ncbi:MAG: amidohydrolase family protein, partial [Bacteroidota bacterium]